MEYGIDISNNNKTINYDEARKFGKIAYIKAGEGHSWIDPDCDKMYNSCRSKGFLIGFYLYCNDNTSPEEQARFFKERLSHYSYDLMPVLDIEVPFKNYDYTDFVVRFCKAMGQETLVYTYRSYYREKLNMKGYKMWLADYTGNKDKLRDNTVIGLQYSSKGLSNKCTDVSEWYQIPYKQGYVQPIDPVKIANDYLKGDSKKIKEVQYILQALGYSFSKVDGVCGSKTTQYIGQLQKELGLNVDYKFGSHTMEKALDRIKKNW